MNIALPYKLRWNDSFLFSRWLAFIFVRPIISCWSRWMNGWHLASFHFLLEKKNTVWICRWHSLSFHCYHWIILPSSGWSISLLRLVSLRKIERQRESNSTTKKSNAYCHCLRLWWCVLTMRFHNSILFLSSMKTSSTKWEINQCHWKKFKRIRLSPSLRWMIAINLSRCSFQEFSSRRSFLTWSIWWRKSICFGLKRTLSADLKVSICLCSNSFSAFDRLTLSETSMGFASD